MALGMFVKVMLSLISVMNPPPCLCSLSNGVVVGYFWCFSFLCEFCFLYCDDIRLGVVYDDFVSDSVLWLIVVWEWVGDDLFVMGCCVVCAWCCCYDLCGCVNGASPVRFVLFYLCAFQMNPVYVVTSD